MSLLTVILLISVLFLNFVDGSNVSQIISNDPFFIGQERLNNNPIQDKVNGNNGEIFDNTNSLNSPTEETFNSMLRLNTQNLPINLSNLVVAVDLTHNPVHNIAVQLQNNLTSYDATFYNITGSFSIPNDVNVLLIPGSNIAYTTNELNEISDWYNQDGARLLWVSGDSDFGGFFLQDATNSILERVGANLRIAADTVEDYVNNDGAYYRVAATNPLSNGALNSQFTKGVSSIIMHGPTSVLGYENNAVVDLALNTISNVEMIMQSSSNAGYVDNDLTQSQLDYYSLNNINGNFPMMAIQDMGANKYTIASGEAIFTDYKSMYSNTTENGIWNGGKHDGKTLVDNIMIWFESLVYTPHAPIFINKNGDFVSQGFNGSGTINDPYLIESLNITESSGNLISISDTTSYFIIRNNLLNGLNSANNGIQFDNIVNGVINNNIVLNMTNIGIELLNNSNGNLLSNNIVHDNRIDGISIKESDNNVILNNTIFKNSVWGISIISSSMNEISNTTFFNNRIAIGVFSNQPTLNLIHHNDIYSNTAAGIVLGENVTGSVVEYNQVHNNVGPGVALFGIDNNVISENTIFENSGSGIVLAPSILTNGVAPRLNTIQNNEIYDNQDAGISLEDVGDGNNVKNNTIYKHTSSENGGAGIRLNLLATATFIRNNDFSNNLNNIIDNGTSNLIENNYYDDWSGVGPYSIDGSAENQDLTPQSNANHMLFLDMMIDVSGPTTLEGNVLVSWNPVDDLLNHPINYSILYSDDDGGIWTQLASGITKLNYTLDTMKIKDGLNILLSVRTIDGLGFQGEIISDITYLVANSAHELSTPTIFKPGGGEILTGIVTISWMEATDSWEVHGVSYTVSYSANGGTTWTELVAGLTTTSYNWDTTTLSNGMYLIRVDAVDDIGFVVETISDQFEIRHEETSNNVISDTTSVKKDGEPSTTTGPTLPFPFISFLIAFAFIGLVIKLYKKL